MCGGGGRGKRGEEVGSIAKTSSLKCFQTAPANMRSVTSQLVVFTYSHFNWPDDHLNYYITVSNFVFDHANHTRYKMKIYEDQESIITHR